VNERLENEAVVEHALDEIRRRDGLEAEAYLRDSHGTSIEVIDGKVESAEVETERGVGVRVLDSARVGFAYTSDLSASGISDCVELAIANARVTSPDESIAFATAPLTSDGDLRIFDAGYESHDVIEKTELCLEIEAAAKRVDRRITSFYKTSYGDGSGVTVFGTTGGAFGTYRSTFFGAGTAPVATEGDDKQIGGFGDGGRMFAEIDAGQIGEEGARRALEKLQARPFKTQRIDIVLEPYRAMELVAAISSLFSAENVLKGKSLLAGKINERVASELVTLRDDGQRVSGRATSPFDGEGIPTQDVTLLRGGVLRAYLQSIKTARRHLELLHRSRSHAGGAAHARRRARARADVAAEPPHHRSDLGRVLARRDRDVPRARRAAVPGEGHHRGGQPHRAPDLDRSRRRRSALRLGRHRQPDVARARRLRRRRIVREQRRKPETRSAGGKGFARPGRTLGAARMRSIRAD
jgi:PmbA protein